MREKAARVEDEGNAGEKKGDIKGPDGETIVKTDKVLIGNKVSWAIAQAIGEVHYLVEGQFWRMLIHRNTLKRGVQ